MPASVSKARTTLLAICASGAFVDWGLLSALQPPFYPKEAEQRGATPTQYGFVFGIVHLVSFLASPFFARYGGAMGPGRVFNFCGFVETLAGFLFGFLDYVQDLHAFLGLSYLLRFLNGFFGAGTWISVVSLLIKFYPTRVATIMAWSEICWGLGCTLGPALGSLLYEAGGFKLPFLTIGTFGMVMQVCLIALMPRNEDDIKKEDDDEDDDDDCTQAEQEKLKTKDKPLTLKAMIKSVSIMLPYVDNAICFCGVGFVEAMVEPHMRHETNATPLQVSAMFLIVGVSYMISSALAGMFCDRVGYPTLPSLLGNVVLSVCMLLIGPAPFLTLKPTIPLLLSLAAVLGTGHAQIMVSTFSRAYHTVKRKDFNDDINTYLLVSGMWSASFYLGNFVGPTVAGFLVDWVGFRTTTLFFFGLCCAAVVMDSVELALVWRRNNSDKLTSATQDDEKDRAPLNV